MGYGLGQRILNQTKYWLQEVTELLKIDSLVGISIEPPDYRYYLLVWCEMPVDSQKYLKAFVSYKPFVVSVTALESNVMVPVEP